MVEHKLKCWPQYFDAIKRGDKPFEVRRDDRGFQKGDVLVLQKYDPVAGRYMRPLPGRPEEWELRLKITYILTGGQFGIEPGYVVLGLETE